MNEYKTSLLEHYEIQWKQKGTEHKLKVGPLKDSNSFSVYVYSPSNDRAMWTYATVGMSNIEDSNPIELHLFSYKEDHSLVELLTAVVYYHQYTYKIGLNHTVNFGRAWQENSVCTHGFISLPYLDGPNLEDFIIRGKIVKCYWLVPITQKEVAYKKKHGSSALEELFEDKGLDYLSPNRKSLI